MNRRRVWHCLSTLGASGLLAVSAAETTWAQYRAGQSESTIRLEDGDSSRGRPTRSVAPPARRSVAQPPGAGAWSNGRYPPSAVRQQGTRAVTPPARTRPGRSNLSGRRTNQNRNRYRGGKPEGTPRLTRDRNRGGAFGSRTTRGRSDSRVRKNRNWALGGEPWRPIQMGANPAARAGGDPRRAINLIDNRLAELLAQRELARNKYQYGGGYGRDLRDFNDLEREIVKLQDQRMGILRANTSNRQALRQAERNYRATRGLTANRYRGIRDTRWPVGEQRTSRWLNDPDYRE